MPILHKALLVLEHQRLMYVMESIGPKGNFELILSPGRISVRFSEPSTFRPRDSRDIPVWQQSPRGYAPGDPCGFGPFFFYASGLHYSANADRGGATFQFTLPVRSMMGNNAGKSASPGTGGTTC